MDTEGITIEQRTLDFVHDVELLTQHEPVCAIFQDFVEELGFANAVCMKLPEAGEDIFDGVLMNSRPHGWCDRYARRDYVSRDPMVMEMFQTYEPYAWSDVLGRREFKKEDEKIVYEASEFGMTIGFVVPIFGSNGYAGVVSVAGDEKELPEHIRSAIQLASIYVHNKLLSVKRSEERAAIRLSKRECECLRWVAAGKSDWDIGRILSISEKTANFHVENAKRKMGVATRIQAVVVSMRQGTILPY